MRRLRYILHFVHASCPHRPGIAWRDTATKSMERCCPACGDVVAPHRVEDLEAVRGLRFGGSVQPQGDNTLDEEQVISNSTD